MSKKHSHKLIVSVLIASMLLIFIPQEAQARNLFRQFFRDLKRGVSFIVKLPDKTTRWMGPVLGPIASAILTQNLAGSSKFGNLFRNAHRVNNAINDIEEQKRLTGEVKQMYRDQATQLRDYVSELQIAQEELKKHLIDRDVSMSDYIKTRNDLSEMIATVNSTADRFESSAERINTGDIIKMATNSLLESLVGDVKNIALGELGDEIASVVNPDVIDILLNNDSRGLDGFLDLLINSNLEGQDGSFDVYELRDRIKDKIKEHLQNSKDGLAGNLKDEINAIIAGIMNETKGTTGEIEKEIENIKNTEKETKKNPYTDDELAATLTEIPKDEFGCRPGYEWQRMSGVGCVQSDCRDVGAHYSYTKACICGFVDPKPGDLTKACMRPSNYLACPSCVFTCVASDADCSER